MRRRYLLLVLGIWHPRRFPRQNVWVGKGKTFILSSIITSDTQSPWVFHTKSLKWPMQQCLFFSWFPLANVERVTVSAGEDESWPRQLEKINGQFLEKVWFASVVSKHNMVLFVLLNIENLSVGDCRSYSHHGLGAPSHQFAGCHNIPEKMLKKPEKIPKLCRGRNPKIIRPNTGRKCISKQFFLHGSFVYSDPKERERGRKKSWHQNFARHSLCKSLFVHISERAANRAPLFHQNQGRVKKDDVFFLYLPELCVRLQNYFWRLGASPKLSKKKICNVSVQLSSLCITCLGCVYWLLFPATCWCKYYWW